jgi:cytochrome c
MSKTITMKIAALLVCGGLMIGCGEQGAGGSSASAEHQQNVDMYKLAHMNGCIDCHRLKSKVIGPTWQEIADRYKDAPLESAREILIERVNKGSKGNWITWKAPDGMPPMERRVSAEHIEILVDYILSLNRAPGVDTSVTKSDG